MTLNLLGYKLIFELHNKEEKQKATGFSSRRWTKSEKDHLLKRYNEGINNDTIAKEMNRTLASIHSMIYKLHKGK